MSQDEREELTSIDQGKCDKQAKGVTLPLNTSVPVSFHGPAVEEEGHAPHKTVRADKN